jgi:predicted RNA binding protein YcfA (HicA-like mRNA interferase family)
VTRLPSLSSKRIIRALLAAGFVEAPGRGKGSHRAFEKIGEPTRLAIVPYGNDIPKGTLLAIIEQSGLSREEFLNLL